MACSSAGSDSSAGSSGSSPVSPKKYDVFVSFRGEDTRSIFINDLSAALKEKGIEAYIDDRLIKGDDIWESLSGAIENSSLSIVVFSENYATSKWCLEELAKIMDCRKDLGQVVIPVFYKIEPTQIRYQKGSYQKAFEKHDLLAGDDESKKSIRRRWKSALTEAANLSGWDSQSPGNKTDFQLIQNIVNEVMQKLLLRYPNSIQGLVGIDESRKHIESLLKTAKVIGIWGMGGIGKTTIARDLFARLFPKYDSVCFLENVSEESKKHGLTYLRGKLFSELLKEENPIHQVVDTEFSMRRLSSSKVFIVLDDVDNFEQLEYLCGQNYLGADSRLIITTRDRHLLINRVDEIYEVEILSFQESLELFSLNAFMKSHPEKEFEQLSKQAIQYAGNNPLALKVLGLHLHSRSQKFWESTFRTLSMYPNEKIQNVLRVSYDGLTILEKKIFLDIAFFFKEKDKDRVMRILDACGFEASSGIDVLVDKALITISWGNRIGMHDLLQEMGLEIVRQECERNPERCSRLRDVEDICKVLEENTGTDAIEGIALDLSQISGLNLSSDTFKKTNQLRFLKFHMPKRQICGYISLPESLEHLPEKLRYLEWNGYSLKSLPPSFCAEFLVEIHLSCSDVEELWQGMQDLKNLVEVNLSECKMLKKLPNLTKATRLKWVNLSGCESLGDVHLFADTIVTLTLDRCKNLKSVKAELHLKSLNRISMESCTSLEEFALSSDLIEILDLRRTAIEVLDPSIGRLRNLNCLKVKGVKLKQLPKELSCLTKLEKLKLTYSGLVIDKQLLRVLFDGLRSLRTLYLMNCSNFFELPDNIDALSELRELKLDGSNIKTLPASIKLLQKLETLSLINCTELLSLPELPPLTVEFYPQNCTSLVSVSSLKTLANNMMGKDKRIYFMDSLGLDEYSLYSITESLQLTMMSAVFHNLLVKAYSVMAHSYYKYNRVMAYLPGSSVSRHFKYRSTESSITIELPTGPSVLGFILSVVVSPSLEGIEEHGVAYIICQCYSACGTQIDDARWYEAINLKSDTIFVWYNPHVDNNILQSHQQVSFKFSVSVAEDDALLVMKECGVRLICDSEFDNVLGEMELEHEKKVELGVRLGLALEIHLNYEHDESEALLLKLEFGLKLDASDNSKLESRRRAVAGHLAAMEKQRQNYSEFIFPPRLTGMWKHNAQGLKNVLFP